VIWVFTLSPSNNLHWFQSSQITPEIGLYSFAMDNQSQLWHLQLDHPSQNALHQLTKSVKGILSFNRHILQCFTMCCTTRLTVKLASAAINTRVEAMVKKPLGRQVRINIALNDSGKFSPAFVICSKR